MNFVLASQVEFQSYISKLKIHTWNGLHLQEINRTVGVLSEKVLQKISQNLQ